MVFSERGQVSFEFILVIFAVIVITTTLATIAGNRIIELKLQHTDSEMRDIANTAQNEIDTASSMSDGYMRSFDLPDSISGINYSIYMMNNFVVVSYEKNAFSVPVQSSNGTLHKGSNTIKKVSGAVIING